MPSRKLFLKMAEITACLCAGGNDLGGKGESSDMGEGGRIVGETSSSLSRRGRGEECPQHKQKGWPQTELSVRPL